MQEVQVPVFSRFCHNQNKNKTTAGAKEGLSPVTMKCIMNPAGHLH